MIDIKAVFSSSGQLSQAISGYQPRQVQLEMAQAIVDVVETQSNLVVEAGTGTGKTFAYLVPSLLAQTNGVASKVIISTGSKNLQDQLYQKDLPLVHQALKSNRQLALLKGRANYLCLYRLGLFNQTRGQLDSAALQDLVHIQKWATATRTGDIGELLQVAEDSTIFPQITSTADNCLGKDCPDFAYCYLKKARDTALAADIVVVNHHLFFADMAIKDTGFGELIPTADMVIFDEAHELPNIASQYFGEHFSTRQLLDLASDCIKQYHTELTDIKQLGSAAEKLQASSQALRLLFDIEPERGDWLGKLRISNVENHYKLLGRDLDFLYQVLKICVSRSEIIDNCFERASNLLALYERMADTSAPNFSYWYETTKRHLVLHQTPLSVADKFADYINQHPSSWIFTSATLSVNAGFTHFTEQMGVSSAKQIQLDSPFDYQQQSLLYVPRYLPAMTSPNRCEKIAEIAKDFIAIANGASLLLFTSYAMMHQVAQVLAEQINNPLLIQGQMGKAAMLAQFLAQPEAVLLATSSFWQGVDIRGDALTCVIIDKLPFASPDEPLLQAQCQNAQKQGKDSFQSVQLPQAVIDLKQGVGRLIRDVQDQGLMVICDDRLVNREYGRIFLQSLPAMKRTRDHLQARQFLIDITKDRK